jgi:hypothetical protein
MKRISIISFLVIILAVGAFLFVPFASRTSCFQNGAVSNSIAQAEVEVAKLLLYIGEDDWAAIGPQNERYFAQTRYSK